MQGHSTMDKIYFIIAMVYLVTFIESKPALITSVASTPVSRRFITPPRITEPPTPGPIDLIKVKRQDFGFDTCAYINGKC